MRVGVVVVSHYRVGEEMLQAVRLIVPTAPDFRAVAIGPKQTAAGDPQRDREGARRRRPRRGRADSH